MNLPTYPEYQDSGVDWLGDIPAHWEILRNKLLLREINEQSVSGREELLTVSQYTGVTRRRDRVKDGEQLTNAASLVGYKIVSIGDLVMNIMLAWNGSLGCSIFDGIVSPSYSIFRFDKEHNPHYFHYLMRTPLFTGIFKTVSTGVVESRLRLYPDEFLRLPSIIPPPDEQAEIVRFLDAAETRIRRYIRAKQKLIKLLNEQKQAIIQQAVTRGLDPDAPMKDSGVEWLGEIPEHWDVIALGVASHSIQTGPFGSQLHSSDYVSNGIPIINPSHLIAGRIKANFEIAVSAEMADHLARHKLQADDIVAARRGELGRCALVLPEQEGWLCGTGSLRIRPRAELYRSSYLVELISSKGVKDTLSLESIGATMDNLNEGMISRLRLPLPPLNEQSEIVDFIEADQRIINKAIENATHEIDLIREYRTRLIADVVTGKVDVRGLAFEMPEAFDKDDLLDVDEDELLEEDELEEVFDGED